MAPELRACGDPEAPRIRAVLITLDSPILAALDVHGESRGLPEAFARVNAKLGQ